MSRLGAIPSSVRTSARGVARVAVCAAMVFGALGVRALAQDSAEVAEPVDTADVAAAEVRDLPIAAADLPERARGPSPTDSQVALMREMDAVTATTSERNELEQAERVAPVDVYYGLPEAR